MLPPPPPPLAKKIAICQLAVPVAEWLRPLTFSDLNRSSSRRCGFEPSSDHMCDKPSSACGWSGGFSRGSPVIAHLMIGSAQNE